MKELTRAGFTPKRTPQESALEERIAEMVPGDFEDDSPILGDLEDGEVDENYQADEAWRKLLLSEIKNVSDKTDETRDAVKALGAQIDHVDDRVSMLFRTQIEDKAELSKMVNKNHVDINSVGNIARDARDGLKEHIKVSDDSKKFKRTQRIAIIGVTSSIIFGAFGVLMAIIQFGGS